MQVAPLVRGLAGRCPRCGGRGIFASLNELTDRCPTCAFGFVREDGYWLGAMIVIIGVIELLFGLFLAVGILLTWPDVPWTALLVVGLLLNGVLPFVAYGWSKSAWVGLHYAFQPASVTEEAEAIANGAVREDRT